MNRTVDVILDALCVCYNVMCCKYDVMSGLSANSQGMLPRAHGAQ